MSRKILFLCGSLARGRDGVGDYTRRLAAELQAQGAEVAAIATHDSEVKELREEEQPEGGHQINTLRIPGQLEVTERKAAIESFAKAFRPDWTSLQYSPYSFDSRGIPLPFFRDLSRLAGDWQWHVMFHELWQHKTTLSKPKTYVLKWLQRRAVKQGLNLLAPEVVNTHLPLYRKSLDSIGVEALPLPLFANIGRAANAPEVTPVAADTFRAAFFSRIEQPEPIQQLVRQLFDHLAEQGKRLEIVLLGGNPTKVEQATAAIARNVPEARVRPLGFLPAEEISAWLASADLAITPIPRHVLGKSSTLSTIIAHRLAVAAPVVRQEGEPFFLTQLNEVVFNDFSPETLMAAQSAIRELDLSVFSIDRIANQLVTQLEACEKSA